MRRLLVFLIWALLATVLAVVWAVFHPDSALVEKAEEWRWIGPYAQELRRRGPEPFSIPPEGTGEQVAEEIPEPVQRRPRPSHSPAPEIEIPVNAEPEGVERVTVKPGIPLLSEPRPGASQVLTPMQIAALKVLDRRPGWVQVQYGDVTGWVPSRDWIGPDPPLGSDPDPVRPMTGRGPDEQRLAWGRARLIPPEVVGNVGPYLIYTDLRDPPRLSFFDRVASGLDAAYRARYGVSPIGDPAEAVVLFGRESDYRAFLAQATSVAELPATGHTGHGIVSLFDGRRPASEVASTLVHELAHLLNRRAIGPALPSWLEEGIADDLSQSQIDSSGKLLPGTLGGVTVRVGRRIEMHGARAALQDLLDAAAAGRLRPLPQLLSLDWDDFVRQNGELNYAQSSFFIRYLLQGEQGALAPGFRAFLREVSDGKPPEPEALREKLGRPWPMLEAGFRLWVLGQRVG
ncbi:MAG: hypothetical protein QOH06_1727 [Acidobacteriota bacterium]|jgi:hypothetical protein|nr:hypothetical protein [Acidobacteriota bacterium]